MMWQALSPTERAVLLGGGFALIGASVAAVVIGRQFSRGLDVRVSVDPETRNLVSSSVKSTGDAVSLLVEKGVPVRFSLRGNSG